MLKKIIQIVIINLFINSCSAQSDFDLTDIKLNRDKIIDIVGSDSEKNADDDLSLGKRRLIVKNNEFLHFNNVNFKGQQNPNNDDHGINGVSFTYNKSDFVITKYDIHIYSLDEAEKIIKTLHEKLRNPDYTYFGREKRENKYSLIWEDQENKILYCLKVSLNETSKVYLTVLHNFDDVLKLELHGPFNGWEKYLYERKKKKNLNYTYQDFLEELKESDPDNYTLKVTK
ncbi:hypothetical protein [Aquimarina agarivorans]|uniref:hypothetical protein n=1 Tax=Aquimarina agarivorans TaxID=980584 RepID=UPI000248FD28|nr:hypothetical protein [Aquimarina agarivorans]